MRSKARIMRTAETLLAKGVLPDTFAQRSFYAQPFDHLPQRSASGGNEHEPFLSKPAVSDLLPTAVAAGAYLELPTLVG